MNELDHPLFDLPAQRPISPNVMHIPSQALPATESLSLVGIHGRWSPEELWSDFGKHVTDNGHAFYGPRYTIEDPSMRYKDQAYELAEKISKAKDIDHDNLTALGHSLGGMLLPDVAELIPIKRIVYINGIIPGTPKNFNKLCMIAERLMKNPRFLLEGLSIRGDLEYIDPWVGVESILSDCTDEQKAYFMDKFRPNRKREKDIILPKRPDVPEYTFVSTGDRTLNPDWQRACIEEIFGGKPDIEFEGDHTPFTSAPKRFADALWDELFNAA